MNHTPTFYLDRPEVANALDLSTAEKLKKQIDLALKGKHQAFIITSSSDKVFCSGGDLKKFEKMKNKKEGIEVNRKIRKILTDFRHKPIFIVSVIEGNAVGGGCELALATDYIIAGAQARFSFRQVQMGLTQGWGGAKHLLYRVNPSTAIDWLSSGRWISTPEGFRSGLIDKCIPSGKGLDFAERFIKSRPHELLGTIKKLVGTQGKTEERIFEKLWWSPGHLKARREARN